MRSFRVKWRSGKLTALIALSLHSAAPHLLGAQGAGADSGAARPVRAPHYWRNFAAGFAASLIAHEGAHVGTALALGARPYFGLDKGRPTVFSGINAAAEPRKQFLFSSMGLNVQALLDEAILDIPHERGSAFERGVLASGIATVAFYITIGRTGSVSDIDYMARTSSLSKTQLSLIYGGIAAMHVVRVRANDRYANFFARPVAEGGLRIGVSLDP
jgi:hypothetical protein